MSIRLIEVKTMQLKLFNSPKAPGYVILSHTWVEGEEVSFQEMSQIAEGISHIAKWKSGYRKIWETCRQSMTHGFEYAWVDTCCIDKTSSAEVTEAINSMFRWYRDAAVCIAYLSDYTCVDSSYMGDMKYCSWFTRGWCLQELIAPKYLVFYDKMWKEFGSKAGLAQLIASITRMDEPVLQDHTAMYSLPVAQRMSWASNRITTRVEDIAYCLLGIFDIHMPMLYGEGEKAFVRLQEEIIRRFNDTSIFLFSPNASELTQWEDIRTWGPTAMLEAISHHDDPELSTEGYIEEVMGIQPCGMFATSPADFHACGDITLVHGSRAPFDREAFSVTNRGVQLGRQLLYCIRGTNFFAWETSFGHSMNSDCFRGENIILRKVGSNLFARVSPLHLTLADLGRPVLQNDICILPQVTASTRHLICRALKRVLRFKIKGPFGYLASLSEPTPRDYWDEPGKLFIINDCPSSLNPFMGSVRIGQVKKYHKHLGEHHDGSFPDIFLHFKIIDSSFVEAFALLSVESRLDAKSE